MTTPSDPHAVLLAALEAGELDARGLTRWMLHAYRYSQLAHAMVAFGVAEALAQAPLDLAALAERVPLEPSMLTRLLAGLAWQGLCEPDPEGRWHLSALGRCLARSSKASLHDDALNAGALLYPGWGALVEGLRTGQTPFELAFDKPFFEVLDEDPEASARFGRIMNHLVEASARSIARACELEPDALVVDVGGGNGVTLAHLVGASPGRRGIVFERAAQEAATQATFARHECSERCEFVAGDFFESVVAGGDVYLLQRVLHDWGDQDCETILARVAEALGPRGRVLVAEELLRDDPRGDHAVVTDLAMLAITGGRERTAAQYAELAGRAGLELQAIRATDGPLHILEFVAGEGGSESGRGRA